MVEFLPIFSKEKQKITTLNHTKSAWKSMIISKTQIVLKKKTTTQWDYRMPLVLHGITYLQKLLAPSLKGLTIMLILKRYGNLKHVLLLPEHHTRFLELKRWSYMLCGLRTRTYLVFTKTTANRAGSLQNPHFICFYLHMEFYIDYCSICYLTEVVPIFFLRHEGCPKAHLNLSQPCSWSSKKITPPTKIPALSYFLHHHSYVITPTLSLNHQHSWKRFRPSTTSSILQGQCRK